MADTTAPETFGQLLESISGGDFHDGATKEMKELVAAMSEVERNVGGKPKGKLVITIDMSLESGIIDIRGSVAVKKPSKVHGRTTRYGTPDGMLLKEDPSQHILALGRKEARDVTPDLRNRGGQD